MPFLFKFASKKRYVNLTVLPGVAVSFRRLFFYQLTVQKQGVPCRNVESEHYSANCRCPGAGWFSQVKWGQSRSFAITLGNEMRKSGFVPSAHHSEPISGKRKKPVDEWAGIYRFDEFAVLKNAECPDVLLECGIIRNKSEETLLHNRAYRQRIAGAMAWAVSAFLDTRVGGGDGIRKKFSSQLRFQSMPPRGGRHGGDCDSAGEWVGGASESSDNQEGPCLLEVNSRF
jgi:hypothetical protein